MRVLIVDDERPARERLHRLLLAEADRGAISAIGEARDGIEALEMLPSFQPDLLLLDIQMPEISGLELAASLPSPAPLVVFVTAYDQHAIAAFDAHAVDYLLKPCDPARLSRALQRARERLAAAQAAAPPAFPAGLLIRQLLVTERGTTRIVPVDAIDWIETADNYVVLHANGGQPLLRQTLAALLPQLGPRFVRCHRRAAVQLARVERIEALDKGDCTLLLHGGARVPCSRQYRAGIMARLQAGG
jgi:two-component system LytT family response regulator